VGMLAKRAPREVPLKEPTYSFSQVSPASYAPHPNPTTAILTLFAPQQNKQFLFAFFLARAHDVTTVARHTRPLPSLLTPPPRTHAASPPRE
jgi:hypothetical protein